MAVFVHREEDCHGAAKVRQPGFVGKIRLLLMEDLGANEMGACNRTFERERRGKTG